MQDIHGAAAGFGGPSKGLRLRGRAIDRVFRLPLAADIDILLSMRRRIPYAVANYEEIVRDNYDFVENTRIIHELEEYEIPVFLRLRLLYWCHGILVL